jgi:hypothetical protein
MSHIVPESIQTISTIALDETYEARLSLMRPEQLYIDLAHETNMIKLQLWLEMFGISMDAIPEGLSTVEYQRLLQNIIIIYRLSGTKRSIQLLCTVLGATSVVVNQTYILKHDGTASYNGLWNYDSGTPHRHFTVSLDVSGIVAVDRPAFIDKLSKLFEVFEPIWIWLESISFDGQSYNYSNNFDFNQEMIDLDFNQDMIDLDFW